LPRHGSQSIILKLPFIRYNGIYELGNVYTTFYQFLYDFGYIGVFVLTAIISIYYTTSYRYVKKQAPALSLKMNLFIYAYLFNDLIMLIFSNRFYETVLNINTIKTFIAVYLIKGLLFDNGFYLGKIKIKLR
ncbi:TPA: O-antigen polymerase, partial [Streptococcus suis]